MSVDEARRLALHDAAAHNRWNAEAAVTLMEMLPPTGWGDVATRQHLDARLEGLEHRIDLRFQLVDQRFGALEERMDGFETRMSTRVESLEQSIDLRIERGLNRSLRWMVGMMIAMTAIFGAITRLG